MVHKNTRDSQDLLYYAGRGAEKQYRLARLRETARNMGELDPARIPLIEEAIKTESKFDIAKSDFDKILERYAGKVAVVAPLSHVKAALDKNIDSGVISVEGTITKVDYKKALFKIATESESVEVTFADFVLQEGCTYPSPRPVIELELVDPA